MSSPVSYVRNFIFGVEDSLVSTVGLLSGIAIADVGRSTILLTGMVLIFVEAISMAAGSFLSESSAESYASKHESPLRLSIPASLIMFFSYFLAGFVPLSPYLLLPVQIAFPSSIIASLIALFLLGAISARISQTRLIRSGLRMLIIGGIAIAVGTIVGRTIAGA